MRTTFSAERHIDASARVIYHCIADYRHHHRPGGFLPLAFSEQEVLRGGVGAGTEISVSLDLGGRRRTIVSSITEPVPGRTLVETGSGIQTTFSVDPAARGARVRIDTVIDEEGVGGVLTRMFAARLLSPTYEDELRRLENLALTHLPPAPELADRRAVEV
jgi:hypothetical protein